MAEITLYGTLATAVAAGVLVANGRPWWHAAAVVAGAVVVIIVLAVTSARFRPVRDQRAPRARRRKRQ